MLAIMVLSGVEYHFQVALMQDSIEVLALFRIVEQEIVQHISIRFAVSINKVFAESRLHFRR